MQNLFFSIKTDSNDDIIILDDVNDTHKPSLNIGMKVFALKDKNKSIWKSAIIKSIISIIKIIKNILSKEIQF